MKKFLVSLIYISLATLVMAYLFKVMRWPGLGEVNIGLFWLHIGAYLGYAALVPDKDSRILFPMGFLVVLLILSTAEIGISNSFAIVGLIVIYVGYHIAMPTYLGKSEIPFIQQGGIVAQTKELTGGKKIFEMYIDGDTAPWLVSDPSLTEDAAFKNLNVKFKNLTGAGIGLGSSIKF